MTSDEGLVRQVAALLRHLPRKRNWQLAGLLCLMLVGAVSELISLGAVIPFLSLLADPTVAAQYPVLLLGDWIGLPRTQPPLFIATILFAVAALISAAIRIALTYVSYRVTFGIGADIATETYRRTLLQPYSYHTAHDSSETIAALHKVEAVVFNVINPIIQGLTSTLLGAAILGALIAVHPKTAFAAAAGIGTVYMVITLATRSFLRENSKLIAENATRRVKAIQEGLGGIRDIHIDGTHHVHIHRYAAIEIDQSQARALNGFTSNSPRHLIEAMIMVQIAVIAYWLGTGPGGMAQAVPVLGALALGAQKLIPLMQQVYYATSSLNGNGQVLTDILNLLRLPMDEGVLTKVDPLPMRSTFVISDVSFRYGSRSKDVLKNVNLNVDRGARVGFIGRTGAGKSTLLDVIMGLLPPTNGHIAVDGKTLSGADARAWRASLAHVPQTIYLANTTLLENIALGSNEPIDRSRAQAAARKAEIDTFIESLPEAYETVVGERGIRLSGGQRQRIGLARAFYKEASVLILDEATSALDEETEARVIETLNKMGRELTIFMISHRPSTLKACDSVWEVVDGSLKRSGVARRAMPPPEAKTES